jgi:hypothetical protein
MPAILKDIISNTQDIYMTDSSINTLLDFERILDELDIYSYENWKQGELAQGPIYEKYFVTCVFMWPYAKMPDPRGGERLLDYDCEIKYKKDVLEYPIKIKTPTDFEPGTKMPKIGKAPVWLVEITVPKKLMNDIRKGSLELEGETVDTEDIDQSYETGLDDNMYKTGEGEPVAPTGQQPAAQPAAQPQPGAPV